MSLNCNEINLILKELDLTDNYIQDIIQPSYDVIVFYVYKKGTPKTILICTAQNSVRINETKRKITKNNKPLRFMEFLKSHIKGCRIGSCEQIGLERVIRMILYRQNPDNLEDNIIFNLYIKLWNNAANIILCDKNDLILETMFRRPEQYEIKDETFIPPAQNPEKNKDSLTKFPIREYNTEGCPPCSFNLFIDSWYSEHAQTLSREALLLRAEKWFFSSYSKRENALNKLLDKQKSFENAIQLKNQGDLILSYTHLIKKDSNTLTCTDFNTGKEVNIIINPNLSPQENASLYYNNYKKALSGAEEIKHDIELAKNSLKKLKKQYEEIKNEPNPVKIEQLLRYTTKPKQQQKKIHPGLDYIIDGWTVYVGRDANENDDLLRHYVRGEDLWLHVRDYPGGYVFIKSRKGKTVPLDILLDAANLAVYYSKARTNTKVDLYYTHVKYLRRAKTSSKTHKGLVLPTQEKNLCITPDKQRLKRLDSIHQENI